MDGVRRKFKDVGLNTYDALSPPLMDAIAGYTAEKAGTAYKPGKPPAGASAAPPQTATAAKPSAAASTTPSMPAARKPGGIAGFFSKLFGG